MSRKAHPATPIGHDASGTLPSAPEARPEVSDPYIGTTFGGRYEIVSKIAEGSQGRVYVARHLLIERLVAIKVLFLTLASENALVSRFLNEGRAAGTLGHPNIVECLDMGYASDGAPYLVMDLLAGQTLAAGIDTLGPFLLGRAAYIGMQLASALGAAHERGIVHRDLKPENVFLVDQAMRPDHVKVLDFGISKFSSEGTRVQTSKGQFLGTPGFMAPEQIDDPASVDARADVYALGATLYHMLGGEPPFADIDFPKVLRFISEEEPRPLAQLRPDLPAPIVAVVERAMSKSRDDRYQTMEEFEEALAPFAIEPVRRRAITAAPSDPRVLVISSPDSAPSAIDQGPETVSESVAQRRRPGIWIAAAAALLFATAIGIFAFRYHEAKAQADAARAVTTAVAAAVAAPASGPAANAAAVVTSSGVSASGVSASGVSASGVSASGVLQGSTNATATNPGAGPANAGPSNPAPISPIAASPVNAGRGAPPVRGQLVTRPKAGSTVARPADPKTGAPAAAAANAPDAPAPSCSPPFYFEGTKKIFKPECI